MFILGCQQRCWEPFLLWLRLYQSLGVSDSVEQGRELGMELCDSVGHF